MRRLRHHAAPRLEAPRHLRRGGAGVLRVAQRPDARAELAGRPCGQLRPGAEGAPHCVFSGLRRALLHVQGREAGAGAQAARVLYRGGRGRPFRPSASGGASTRRTCSRGCSGARTLREARRQLMAVGESPKVAISSPAQCGLRLRRGARIRELPELRRWCEALGQEYGAAAGRAGARDLPEAAQGEAGGARGGGEAEDPGQAGRKCALCGCGLTAGTCELDHVVPVRLPFALCRRCAATATARRR